MRLVRDLGMMYPTEKSKERKRYGIYECPVCKKEFKAQSQNVKNGNSTQCRACADSKYGEYNKRIYSIWKNIKSRTNPNSKSEGHRGYLEKNITMCDEWKSDFLVFHSWALDNGYNDDLSIDRIDNDGNYEPSNCRWTTMNVQGRNTRRLFAHNTSGFRGVSYSNKNKKWIAKIKINNKTIYIGSYNSKQEAADSYDYYVIKNKLEHTINGKHDI